MSKKTGLVLTAILVLFTFNKQALANTPSSLAEVVRIQGPNGNGGSGSLIGLQNNGSQIALTFLAADHTMERLSSLSNIGFGDKSSPLFDLSTAAAQNVQITTRGPNGTEDIAVIGVTLNLNGLTATQQSFLNSLNPLNLKVAPASLNPNYEITDYGYGSSGANTIYGSQETFNNIIDGYQTLVNQSYTVDKNNVPILFSQEMMSWTYNDPNTGDWVTGEGSGYSGYSGSPLTVVIGNKTYVEGIQAHGSDTINLQTSAGVRFTSSYVNWIQSQSNTYLSTLAVPEPDTFAMFLAGISVLGLITGSRRRSIKNQ